MDSISSGTECGICIGKYVFFNRSGSNLVFHEITPLNYRQPDTGVCIF